MDDRGSVRLGEGAEWPGRGLDPASWPRPPGTGGGLRTVPGPRGLARAPSRRAWAAPLWSPANEAAYGTGGKTRACAASAPRHLRPASRPASSRCGLRPPPSLSRLPPGLLPTPRPGSHGGVSSGSPWRSAEWLGSVSAARGVPPRTGPQKRPRVPERRACGGRAPAPRVALSPARATGLASSAHAADEVGPQHGEVS